VVKGATLLRVWQVPYARPTRDIDFVGRVPGASDALVSLVRECIAVAVTDDGLHFDDEIAAEEIRVDDEYPVLLPDLPAPRILAYDPATSIAEKVEAMVKLGDGNSRLKDFYDVWLLAISLRFDGALMADAFSATFRRRGTEVPDAGAPFVSDEFVRSPLITTQWGAFRAKAGIEPTLELPVVVEVVRRFTMPVLDAVSADVPFLAEWSGGGPWRERSST